MYSKFCERVSYMLFFDLSVLRWESDVPFRQLRYKPVVSLAAGSVVAMVTWKAAEASWTILNSEHSSEEPGVLTNAASPRPLCYLQPRSSSGDPNPHCKPRPETELKDEVLYQQHLAHSWTDSETNTLCAVNQISKFSFKLKARSWCVERRENDFD